MKMSNRCRVVLSKEKIISVVLIFVVLFLIHPPEGLNVLVPMIGNRTFEFSIISVCILAVLFIYCACKRKSFPKSLIPFLAFFIYGYMCNVIKGSIKDATNIYISFFSAIMLIYIFEKKLLLLMDGMWTYLYLWCVINLICVIAFPEGMYVAETLNAYTLNWILGYKESFQFYVFPFAIFSLMNMLYQRKQGRSLVGYLICVLQAYLAGNMMLFVSLVVFGIFVLFKLINFTKVFNPIVYFIIYLVLNEILISLFYMKIPALAKFMTNTLGKTMTIGGRVEIWDVTERFIAKSPILGYGNLSNSFRLSMYQTFSHAHNQSLEVMFQGGIIWLAIYIILNIIIICHLKKNIKLPSGKIFSLALLGFYLMSTVEIMLHKGDFTLWMVLLLSLYSENLHNQMESEKPSVVRRSV